MKTLKKIIKIILCILLAIIFVASVISIISSIGQKKNGYAGAFGYTFEVVQTDSMSGENGFEIGDIVIGKVIDADTVIEEGDVISFLTYVGNTRITKSHRVSRIWEEGTFGLVYETWGDNRTSCPTPDAGYRTRDEIISINVGKIRGAGKVIMALKTPAGYLALAIPIGLYILYELFVLFSIFMTNKKEQMLAETKDAREEIIREYLASQQKNNPGADPGTDAQSGTELPEGNDSGNPKNN